MDKGARSGSWLPLAALVGTDLSSVKRLCSCPHFSVSSRYVSGKSGSVSAQWLTPRLPPPPPKESQPHLISAPPVHRDTLPDKIKTAGSEWEEEHWIIGKREVALGCFAESTQSTSRSSRVAVQTRPSYLVVYTVCVFTPPGKVVGPLPREFGLYRRRPHGLGWLHWAYFRGGRIGEDGASSPLDSLTMEREPVPLRERRNLPLLLRITRL